MIQKDEIYRNEELHEIIGRPPGALIRWGIIVFWFVFLMLLVLTWIIQYPDIVKARIVITTEPAPINLVVRTPGKIVLLKPDNANVKRGDMLGLIESSTNLSDLISLDSLLNLRDSLSFSPTNLALGDLQTTFDQYEKAQKNVRLFYLHEAADEQIDQLNKQISFYKKLIITVQSQLKIAKEETLIAKQKFITDSILFHQKVTSSYDFGEAKVVFLSQQRGAKDTEVNIINYHLEIAAREKQIAEINLNRLENKEKLHLDLTHTRKELIAQVSNWKESHLFVAKTNGSLSYLDFLEDSKFVEVGKPLFSIIPEANTIVGRAELPLTGSGKVKEGQVVKIRLDNFPYEQYGMLQGVVQGISSMPSQDKYMVKIDMPDTLVTTSKRTITFRQQMQGETEIITEDARLLERFFFQLIKVFKR